MYLDKSKTTINSITYSRVLLRESYREGKKIRHRTIANLSKCKPEEIKAIETALKHKKEIYKLESVKISLDAARVKLPKILPHRGIEVTTKTDLPLRF